MINYIIKFSIKNKFLIVLLTIATMLWGVYSLTQISIGAVPDVTNNQVQVITTSRNLATQDVEQFITYPVELEMANLPGVTEIRSISKFGLSVVTIVFEEEMGTFLPRQLISEKLSAARKTIPEDLGTPELGPITTGLGEIYQYLLEVKPGYEDKFSTMELRTIQDWIVRRQLSGIPGVVEVATWGGYLKQYEVAVTPQRLKGMNVTITDVFNALESNNDIVGGGYIEKMRESYFVRGEGTVKTLEDIENIVVKNFHGIPILIKDVGTVKLGAATRFGAITANGKGEVVMGQVMMLKGGNSSKVIKAIKERVAEVQKTLPEGIYINPFLERTELIEKTTETVTENLLLGALIVVFVLILLLGNWRSGLIVASVIPISLLFSISLMNLFGITANLMSLGAIDFGIIIDGAVIIVEYVVFSMTENKNRIYNSTGIELREIKNEITRRSASKMMRSAIYGQIIILIVFIPILTLSGIEGKMFIPMGLAFSFAVIGAMILCLTFVPVMASWFSHPEKEDSNSLSKKLMDFIQKIYKPVIHFAIRQRALVIGFASVLLIFSIWIYANMGGEFLPTLDEGDLTIQPVLKPGTSLSETIRTTTKIEVLLLDNFPEVVQVASRIGAAEVPTDPMSMEMADIIIKLKPKEEWVSADTKDELADKIKEKLSVLPGIEYEFTQPIEMRFNELITGVTSDIAIKIFGDDLDVLFEKGNKVKELIKNVEGAADITVEQISGLPQMSVKYDRKRVAQYGLNIKELNKVIAMAFAGVETGTVYEGEKRFSLVVRFDKTHRLNIENLQNLYVDLPTGKQIPINEVADVVYTTGPAQISRDDTQRRIEIGINVRNRDIESIVKEIKMILGKKLILPYGYHISYGGQFENLQNANKRLLVAVPVALSLIFILLYFTFSSVRQALLVFSAIPLAAIGGVLFLWVREMPFSISAGVGFIALFGIAVLNGIVLIDYFNELKKEGVMGVTKRVIIGTQMRLRPVLLTASAAALGFFPMAFSESAGAEVQRPLATVVIGGLASATLLTLVVLPALYSIFTNDAKPEVENKLSFSKILKSLAVLIVSGVAICSPSSSEAQKLKINNFEDAYQIALRNNSGLKAEALKVDKAKTLEGTAVDLEKTSLYFSRDENNVTEDVNVLRVWGIGQNFNFPTVYKTQSNVQKANTSLTTKEYNLSQLALKKATQLAYYELLYSMQKLNTLMRLDSIYVSFADVANKRYELGETNFIEKLTAQAKREGIYIQTEQAKADVNIATENLKAVLQTDSTINVTFNTLEKLKLPDNFESEAYLQNLDYFNARQGLDTANIRLERSTLLPDIQIEYFIGRNPNETKNFNGFQFGVSVPVWQKSIKSRISAAKIQANISKKELEFYLKKRKAKISQLKSQYNKYNKSLTYFEKTGLKLASELKRIAIKSYQAGETHYLQYIESIENALNIQLNYLDNLNNYNQIIIEITYQ